MKTDLEKILINFEHYCTNEIISGKARSYRLATQYLCEFLGIKEINRNSLEELWKIQEKLKNKNGIVYRDLLKFLSHRNQSSYLLKGWINAAVNHFLIFIKKTQ